MCLFPSFLFHGFFLLIEFSIHRHHPCNFHVPRHRHDCAWGVFSFSFRGISYFVPRVFSRRYAGQVIFFICFSYKFRERKEMTEKPDWHIRPTWVPYVAHCDGQPDWHARHAGRCLLWILLVSLVPSRFAPRPLFFLLVLLLLFPI